MLKCNEFYNLLTKRGVDFYAGVPDSLLKDICAYIFDHTKDEKNIIAANEGNAVALAAGYHLATGKYGLVYMQNSGQGNALNPLMSLTDGDVYSIPLLLLIGWRGEPGIKDEPQHGKQGKITLDLLDTLGIPYHVLPDTINKVQLVLDHVFHTITEKLIPYALVVRKGTFEHYDLKNPIKTSFQMCREDTIKLIVDQLDSKAIVVSTTGKTSRELFEYREALNQGHEKDFLTVGSMGHSSQIALAIALSKPDRDVFCFDGDGAVIMHMGSMAIIGSKAPENFKHLVLNNGAHDSVGGQPTAALSTNIPAVARACGYKTVITAITSDEIIRSIRKLKSVQGPALLEIKINKGARKDLGRPTATPIDNKNAFMRFIKGPQE